MIESLPPITEVPKPKPPSVATLRDQLRPALAAIVILTLLTGVLFPLLLAVVGRALFARQADGGLIERDGQVVGAELIGQSFRRPGYFHPRPSVAGVGYDGLKSGGSNLSPHRMCEGTRDITGIRQLTDEYRRSNGLGPETAVPIDAVTRSGSGLDPHISPADAELQVPRVARERQVNEENVRRLVTAHTTGRQLGFLGEPRVAVLPLNLDLDRLAPLAPP
jgi:K+-transporting ATPase ATPase C chain